MDQPLQIESQVLAIGIARQWVFQGRGKHTFEFATAAEDSLKSPFCPLQLRNVLAGVAVDAFDLWKLQCIALEPEMLFKKVICLNLSQVLFHFKLECQFYMKS